MKKILTSALLALPLGLGLVSCANMERPAFFWGDAANAEPIDTTKHITLVFAGDLMQHMPQIYSARNKEGGYDYTECFAHIREQIAYADIAVANFETTLAGPPYSGFPRFSAPDDFLVGVKDCGFDVLLNANNHVCDKGRVGIERTIAKMDSLGIPHLGAYADSTERAKKYPLLVEKNGFRLVFLNYTYGTNGLPVPEPCMVNRLDRDEMSRDIAAAKGMNPDAIIAFVHWGLEYHLQPNNEQRELADWLFEQGVDHVIGGHPHVVQPMEIRTDADSAQHVLAYSLGNFVSNQYQPNTYGGMLVHMELEKDSVARLTSCDYSLYFVTRPAGSGHKSHRVYDISTPDSELTKGEMALRDNFAASARDLFARYNVNVKERLNSVSVPPATPQPSAAPDHSADDPDRSGAEEHHPSEANKASSKENARPAEAAKTSPKESVKPADGTKSTTKKDSQPAQKKDSQPMQKKDPQPAQKKDPQPTQKKNPQPEAAPKQDKKQVLPTEAPAQPAKKDSL